MTSDRNTSIFSSMPFSISIRFSWVSNLMRSFFSTVYIRQTCPAKGQTLFSFSYVDIFQTYEFLPCSFCERCIYTFKLSQTLRDRLFLSYTGMWEATNMFTFLKAVVSLPLKLFIEHL